MTKVSYDIIILNDNVLEGDETFYVFINPATLPRDVTVGDINQAGITIINDDSKWWYY